MLAASWQRAIHVPGRYATIQDLWVTPAWRSRGDRRRSGRGAGARRPASAASGGSRSACRARASRAIGATEALLPRQRLRAPRPADAEADLMSRAGDGRAAAQRPRRGSSGSAKAAGGWPGTTTTAALAELRSGLRRHFGVRPVAADAGDEELERDARARCTAPSYLEALDAVRCEEPVVMPDLAAARPRARHPGQRGLVAAAREGVRTAIAAAGADRRRRPLRLRASAARPATTPAATSSAATAT